MKPLHFTLLACALIFCRVAADESKTRTTRLAQIDLELSLEQYKQARMELFRTKMQLNLLQTDEGAGEETPKRQRERLEDRLRILTEMADEMRARAVQIERDLSEASREGSKNVSAATKDAVGDTDKSDLGSRMLGTWRLVSFADGRVSDANEGELKFIGDRHWSVSRLNPRTGKLDYHMGGTYTLDGDEYVETIEYGTGGPIGETFIYRLTVEGDKFTQIGVGSPWSLVFKRAK
jgi:hypothetical protein